MQSPNHYDLVIQIQRSLKPMEPGEYLLDLYGTLRFSTGREDSFWKSPEPSETSVQQESSALESSTVVGNIQGYVIQAQRALQDGRDLFDECDAYDQESLDLAASFYDPETGQFLSTVQKQWSPRRLDVIGVECMNLHPAHRGKRLGQWMVRRFVEWCGGGCGLLALRLLPRQLLSGGSYDLLDTHPEKNPIRAKQKLKEYFSDMGFEMMKGSDYLVLPLHQDPFVPDDEELDEEYEEEAVGPMSPTWN